ncbi:MAG: Hydroxysqualene dehydroxylase [Ignavibacteria bacterium]|nr:Hydroxysqualene dehydroxylase [Ignavibacteria bacterium]
MRGEKSVCIIGGGMAGLAASVFLADCGFKVILAEATPKLGGRAYSYFDREKDMFFDNGQHLFAGWYKYTFEYLKLINSLDKLNFQKALEIFFINSKKEKFILRIPDLPAPFNLINGLMKFKALTFKDKFGLAKINKLFLKEDIGEEKSGNAFEFLLKHRQSKNLMTYFWEPFCIAVFNTRLENISVKIFINTLKEGFSNAQNSVLVFPEADLNTVLVNGAVDYLNKKGACIKLSERLSLLLEDGKVAGVINEKGGRLTADYYISAVPFFSFKDFAGERFYAEEGFKSDKLKFSGIVSIHLFFNNDVNINDVCSNVCGMTGLINMSVQWIFLKSSRHLSLVISGADEAGITEKSNEEIFEIAVTDLSKTIEGFNKNQISDYRVIKEKRATFIPDAGSEECRPQQKTRYDNFYICGDWTNTGLPATIESAARSARICCDLIIEKENSI